jgi:hypothetical protein
VSATERRKAAHVIACWELEENEVAEVAHEELDAYAWPTDSDQAMAGPEYLHEHAVSPEVEVASPSRMTRRDHVPVALFARQNPDPAAALLDELGVDQDTTRRRLEAHQ